MKKIITACFIAGALSASGANTTPLWLRDAKISPDGTQIAFTYRGDIFTVPVNGGAAKRLTSQASYETSPIWSPDSKLIAFASDRYGNFDVFTIPVNGNVGEWTQLTFNSASETPEAFTPDGKQVLYSASIQDPATSALFPTSVMSELYSVALDGSAPKQILATPVRNISWAPDGKSFLYQDVKGFEDTWRKHHTSSVTRDIWRYTPASDKHEVVINHDGEDLWPIDAGDEIYFISERKPSKSQNVYCASKSNPNEVRRLTSFDRHPVRFLSRANNGVLAFAYDGELYTLTPGAKASKVKVEINADFPDEVVKKESSRGATNVVPSSDGKSIAFVYRGDVYVTPVDYATTKQITSTPQAEGNVTWSGDSTLYYDSRRDGRSNIYRATVARDKKTDFAHATIIDEECLFAKDKHERFKPVVSPDGKMMAFILDRNIVAVKDLKSGKVRQLTDGSTFRHRNCGFSYTWSPDSKWLALEIVDRKHDPYTDIAVINVESGELTNITNSGYFDENPKWVMNGNAIAFASERLGMRNHASWGSQMDVFIAFMNDKAYERFKLSKEERELFDEDAKKDKSKDSTIVVQLDGIDKRIERLSPISTDLIDFYIDKDGKKLTYTSSADGSGAYVWEYDLEEHDLSMKRRHSERAYFEQTPDGKNVFLIGKTAYKYGSSPKAIRYNAKMTLDPAAERDFMLDFVECEVRERFYTADLNGVDWAGLVNDYRRFMPHISNNYDFAELLSELLGELNVSHTGGRYRGSSEAKAPESTASLGVLLDMTYIGNGARIAEVLAHGPLYGKAVAGDIITKVNGEDVCVKMPLERHLSDAAGRRTLVEIKHASGDEESVVVRPISKGRERSMLYDRWVANRAHDVDSLSNGRLGYVHISSMDDESFRKVYQDLLGKYNDREGVIIDIRWNGGGRLHEDIEVLLSGKKYFTQEVRGNATCDMPSRRWNKPSIMLMSEACYSNAHGTPWVYSNRGLGKLVGMPVPGTMSSVNWVTMQDPTMVFGIPVLAYRLADGSILENQQLEPDVKVANNPSEIVRGIDAQLQAAVKELLHQIDSQK